MKHLFRKAVSFILAFSMILSLSNVGIFVSANETTELTYQELSLDTTTTVSVVEGNATTILRFTPDETDAFIFESFCAYDTFVRLVDSEMNFIYSDDDSGDANNFQLAYTLEAGKTYCFEVIIRDGGWGDVDVMLSKSPVANVVAKPFAVFEGQYIFETTEFDYELQEYLPVTKYCWWNHFEFTVTFEDGTSTECKGGFFLNDEQVSINFSDSQKPNNEWSVGNTYTESIMILGVKAVVEISIIESPVESITVEPIVLYENTGGSYCSEFNEETGQYDLEYYGYYWQSYLNYTIHFKDQSSIQCGGTGFDYNGSWIDIEYTDSQCYNNVWTVGNTYIENITVLGVSADVQTTIVESPIESITVVGPVEVIENYHGHTENDTYDENGYPINTYFRYEWEGFVKYIITTRGGDEIIAEGTSFEYEGVEYSLLTSDKQSYYNQWTIGNTYTETIDALGATAEVEISIIESPVESINIDSIEVYQNCEGGYTQDFNNQTGEFSPSYFRYDWWFNCGRIEVALKNGDTVYLEEPYFEYEGNLYDFRVNDDQSYYNQWIVGGTYTGEVNLLGATSNVNVSILSSPIESIEFAPIVLGENTCGYLNPNPETGEMYYHYMWWEHLSYTITMSGGHVVEGQGPHFEYDGKSFNIYTEDTQSVSSWYGGATHEAFVNVLGDEYSIDVTITAVPVDRIEFKPVTLIEYNGGRLEYEGNEDPEADANEYYCYYWWDALEYTVYMSNGDTVEGTGTSFYYNELWYYFDYSSQQSYDTRWTADNTYTVQIRAFNAEYDVEVSILNSPVKNVLIEPVTVIDKYHGYNELYGYYDENNNYVEDYFYMYDWWNHISYRITLENDEEITGTGVWFNYNGEDYSMDWSYEQSYEDPWSVGETHTVTVGVMGIEVPVEVTIIENLVKKVTVEPILLIAGRDCYNEGYYNEETGEWIYYSIYTWWEHVNYTVEFSDGSKVTTDQHSFMHDGQSYNMSYYMDQHPDNIWYPGNTYTTSMQINGIEGDVEVTITDLLTEDGFEYIVQNDAAYIISCYDTEAVLTIPSELGGYPVVAIINIADAAYYAEEVIIPDSVTSISDGLFDGFEYLKKITVGSGISILDNSTFSGCPMLECIVVSEENENYASVDGLVFDKAVTTVVAIPNAKTGVFVVPDTATDITLIFEGDYKFTVDLGNSNTGLVIEDGVTYNSDKTIIYAVDKSKTGSYVMPESVTEISEYAFQNSMLSEVTVSDSVTEITYYAFYECLNLEKVVLPDTLVSIANYSFYGCEALSDINMPESLEAIGEGSFAFTGPISVNIPSGVGYIPYQAFYYSELKELTLNEGLKAIETEAFAGTMIKDVTVPDSVMYMGPSVFAQSALETAHIGSGLQSIPSCTFAHTNLSSFIIPTNILYICDSAFAGTKLTSIVLPETLIEIWNGAFQESTLTEVIFENDDLYMEGNVFLGCPLKNLDLPKNISIIPEYAFSETDITSLTVPESVVVITYRAFAYSENLAEIDIPETLESLSGTAFDGTAWLESQPDGVVYLENVLYGYKGNMPANTNVKVKEGTRIIADYAFDTESNLRSIALPASLEFIGSDAFTGCLWLDRITVDPNNPNFYAEEGVLFDADGNVVWSKYTELVELCINDSVIPYGYQYFDWQYSFAMMRNASGEDCHVEITPDMVYGFDPYKVGLQTVTISFGKIKVLYDIEVSEPDIDYITVNSVPNKTQYDLNQPFRSAGLSVYAVSNYGYGYEITDYEISGFDSSTPGSKTVTVSYMGKTAEFDIVVNDDNTTYASDEQKIEVSVPKDVIEEGAVLKVEEKPVDTVIEEVVDIPEEIKESNTVIFDIFFEKEEETVQPTEEVTVSIPVPEGVDGSLCKIYHIADGICQDMNATFEDGFLVFKTPHFSYYALVNEGGVSVSGNVTSYGEVDHKVTVTLSKDGKVVETITTYGAYEFVNVEAGDYTITFEKFNHTAVTEEITVGNSSVTVNAELDIIGDVDGDKMITEYDSQTIVEYILGNVDSISDNADINGDGKIDLKDALLYKQFLGGYNVKHFN